MIFLDYSIHVMKRKQATGFFFFSKLQDEPLPPPPPSPPAPLTSQGGGGGGQQIYRRAMGAVKNHGYHRSSVETVASKIQPM